jgi:hypothetical protein
VGIFIATEVRDKVNNLLINTIIISNLKEQTLRAGDFPAKKRGHPNNGTAPLHSLAE